MDISSHNNTIVINDSDSEINSKDDSIIECSPEKNVALSTCLQQKSRMIELRKKKLINKRKSSVILLDNSSPVLSSNESRSLFEEEGENIAQTEDDVIELWSCIGTPSKTNKDISNQCKKKSIKKKIFRIDTKPSFDNLQCLNTYKMSVRKKQKKTCFSVSTNNTKNKSFIRIIPKYVNERQKTKRHNIDLISTHVKFKKKKTGSIDATSNQNKDDKLREIIIDGCNVARMHTNGHKFSEKGILLMVDYFKSKNHVVKVFLPQYYRKTTVYPILETLYKEGIVVFTPSRNIAGKQITPYDDRYILEYATKCEGIVISSDQYRDLYKEKPEWRDTIVNRLLTPTFVGDYIMFPEDPLGKSGPNLYTFLRHRSL